MEPKITVKGKLLTIEIDLTNEGEPSKSGKSVVIASTHGNKTVKTPDGDVVVGVNAYRRQA